LIYTSHLWLARLSRAFDDVLSAHHYEACCGVFLSSAMVDQATDQVSVSPSWLLEELSTHTSGPFFLFPKMTRTSGPALMQNVRSIFEASRSQLEHVEALWSVVERPEQLFGLLLEAAAFFSLQAPSPRYGIEEEKRKRGTEEDRWKKGTQQHVRMRQSHIHNSVGLWSYI